MADNCRAPKLLRGYMRSCGIGVLGVALLGAILLLQAAFAEDVVISETWSLAKLQGQNIGYEHRTVVGRRGKAGMRYVTTEEEVLKIKRMDQELTVNSYSWVFETIDGVVIDFEKKVEEGGSPVITRGYREGDQMVVWERGAEARYPVPKVALGPYAADLKTSAVAHQPGATLECQIFDVDLPQRPVLVTEQVLGQETKGTLQGDQALWKVKSTMDVMPGFELDNWVDDHGATIVSELPFGGFGNLVLVACSKQEAMQPLVGSELFNASVVVPDKPVTNYQSLSVAHYRLSGPDKMTLLTDLSQTSLPQTDGSVWVTVHKLAYNPADVDWSLPAEETPNLKSYLVASTYLEINDPTVRSLAREAVGSETNPLLAARKIEAFVKNYITTKDMSVGFGSAADTARSRTGDCTEHAVLAAALGRVVGLPTRVVMGLGYLPINTVKPTEGPNGMFGFHMWAEAYLGGDQWVAMDSALGGFDVGHIAFVTSDLSTSSDLSQSILPVVQMIGKLKIEVEELK